MVPSARSASTALVTHAVSGLPLVRTAPNCSGCAPAEGSWPTMTPLSSWAADMKNAVGRSATIPSICLFFSAWTARSLSL